MRGKLWLALCAPALLSVLAPGAAAIDVDLKQVRFPDEAAADGAFLPAGERLIGDLSTAPPEGWSLPRFAAATPLYALVRLGDEETLFVLDKAAAAEEVYTRVYCDANGNRSLADEEPLENVDPAAAAGRLLSKPVDVQVKLGGQPVPYSFRLAAETLSADVAVLRLISNCCYEGDVRIGDETFRFRLGDGDVNGRFDDYAVMGGPGDDPYAVIEPGGDLLCVTTEDLIARRHSGPLGRVLGIAGGLFDVRVDVALRKLHLEAFADALATVRISTDAERIVFAAEAGKPYVVIYQPGRKARVPAGRFRVAGYNLYREDRQKDLWFLSAAHTARTPFVQFPESGAAALNFGEPFTVTARVPAPALRLHAAGELAELPIELLIEGKDHEVVTSVEHVAGDATRIAFDPDTGFPEAPTYTLMAGSKAVDRGSFEYRDGFRCVLLKSDLEPGQEYGIACKFEVGPFKSRKVKGEFGP